MQIQFLGATGTVTGSRYLIQEGSASMLVDCGLFQGYKQLRLRNWEPLPVKPSALTSVVLTHAQLDHSGYLPLLVKNGFRGKKNNNKTNKKKNKNQQPNNKHQHKEEAE